MFLLVSVYLPPFISQILDFTCRMVLIFILIYFERRETENQRVSFTWRSTKVKTQRQGNNSSVILVGVEIIGNLSSMMAKASFDKISDLV